MNIKKIATAAFVSVLLCGLISASATAAYIKKEAYNEPYEYSGTYKQMNFSIKGTATTASTTASNPTNKISRYFYTYVAEKGIANNAVIRKDERSVQTTNAGAGSGIPRHMDNKYVYYNHKVIIKTDEDNNVAILNNDYKIYQKGN